MKKKILPVIAAISFIVVIVLFIVLGKIIEKYTPTKETKDLAEHYHITSDEEVAIIYNNELLDAKAKLIDGVVYLNLDTVKVYINDRFYWDSNENLLRYTTANDLISVPAEGTNYTVTKDSHSSDHIIVKSTADTAYIAVDFVKQYSDFNYEIYENPNRIVIDTIWGDHSYISAKRDTVLRVLGGIKSPILTEVEKEMDLRVLETLENWMEVMTEDGIIGYVKSKDLGKTFYKTYTSDFVPEEYTHITKDFEINMAWHQVISRSANSSVSTILQNSKGINVLSPTWFYVKDTNGSIGSVASSDYVNYCHQQGVEVWALVSDFGAADQGLAIPDMTELLTYSSHRDNLVNNLISNAIQYNLDGINVDFEKVNAEVEDAFIQFIRELSLKCANNGIVLSVDNYTPFSYNAFYDIDEQGLFADYVCLMAYDEYHGNSEKAGPSASLQYVQKSIDLTLSSVPAEQLILGMPFYSRIWCTKSTDGGDELSSYAAGMKEQQNLVNVNGATPVWIDELGLYYAEYTNGGSLYQIWMEDTASIEAKLKVMDSYGLAGGAFWKLGLEQSTIWDTIIKYIN